ncbi:MAG TPA: hypothetical protein VLB67_02990 [Acidimicrobiia bacterium]|nr:hypothetical protein [Acidimicrobiia bacterium]
MIVIGLLVGLTAVSALLSEDDVPITAEMSPAPVPSRPLSEWAVTHFPGEGSFVDVAVGDTGSVAIAHIGAAWSSGAGAPMVWAHDGSEWRTLELEDSARARPVSVAFDGELVVVVGTVGDESPTATVWSGPLGGPLGIVDRPFASPGRLEVVRVLDGRLVIVGRLTSTPFDPTHTSRVLTGRPGDWTDITPPGSGVVVNEVMTTGQEWVAVGGSGNRAAIWHSSDGGAAWSEVRPETDPGTMMTDVAAVGPDIYAIARQVDNDSRLLRHREGVWLPVGEPGSRAISWIGTVGGELVGGQVAAHRDRPHLPYLWRLLPTDRWAIVSMQNPEHATGGWTTVFAAAADDLLVGSSLGQPAIWHPSSVTTVTMPDVPDGIRQWELVATLPWPNTYVWVEDDVLLAKGLSDDAERQPSPTAFVSEDGSTWEALPLPDDWTFSGMRRVAGKTVVVGSDQWDVAVGVLEDDGFRTLAAAPGRLSGFDAHDDEVILYVRLASTTTRFTVPLNPELPVTETVLSWNPVNVMPLGDGLVLAAESVGDDWPPGALRVSVDGGRRWTAIDIRPWHVLRLGDEVVIVTGDPPQTSYRLVLDDDVGVEPVTLPDEFLGLGNSHLFQYLFDWAGGVATREVDAGLLWLPSLRADPVTIDVSPATGFNGAFLWPTDGYVVASEGGEPVLYRWLGLPDD